MKLNDVALIEMPIKTGSLRKLANNFIVNNKKFLDASKKIADLEKYDVKQNNSYLSLWDNDEIVLAMRVVKDDEFYEIDDIWVKEEFLGKKLFSKMLWFLKSRLNYSKIVFGPVHSDETFNLIKNGGLSHFSKSWINLSTKEIEPFEKDEVEKFYKTKNWRLLLENEDEFNWSLFNTGLSWIQESYEWPLE